MIYNKGKEIVSGAVDTGKQVVQTLHDDVVGYAKGVKDTVDKTVGKVENVVVHGEDTIGDVGKSFAWPLGIGAAIVGGMFLMKK